VARDPEESGLGTFLSPPGGAAQPHPATSADCKLEPPGIDPPVALSFAALTSLLPPGLNRNPIRARPFPSTLGEEPPPRSVLLEALEPRPLTQPRPSRLRINWAFSMAWYLSCARASRTCNSVYSCRTIRSRSSSSSFPRCMKPSSRPRSMQTTPMVRQRRALLEMWSCRVQQNRPRRSLRGTTGQPRRRKRSRCSGATGRQS
jgi:hypothetical protein